MGDQALLYVNLLGRANNLKPKQALTNQTGKVACAIPLVYHLLRPKMVEHNFLTPKTIRPKPPNLMNYVEL